ncbi:unnamed protein product [Blepharisma stoltei]|uniref:Calponin-homology (CH) domain-containing protein n=1 Tax=Blepharisma stoltei TaxID=1481888 RepID=A0AAU9JXW8_9CILI|nr:unnamed protein product [Blepharisma stoltei]
MSLRSLSTQRTSSSRSLPSISVSQSTQKIILKWINNLNIWKQLAISDLPERFRTGVLPLKLLERIDPEFDISRCFLEPRSKDQCLTNIKSLVKRLVGNFGMRNGQEIVSQLYQGSPEAAWTTLEFMIRSVMIGEVKSFNGVIMNWLESSLQVYNKNLLVESIEEPYTTLVKDFANGVNLICILHLFMDEPKLALANVYSIPENKMEVDHNLSYFFQSVARTKIPLLFSLEEFKENNDPDFLLLQLFYIFLEFKDIPINNDRRRPFVFKDDKRISQKRIEESIENALTVLSTKPETHSESDSSKASGHDSHQGEGSSFGVGDFQEYSFSNESESPTTLDAMEKQVIQQERKLMYIADLRKKKETKRLIYAPSLQQLQIPGKENEMVFNSPSQKCLSHAESLICFLLTPRIVKVNVNNGWIRVLLNIIPNENLFSAVKENYLLECRELSNMNLAISLDINDTDGISKGKNNELVIHHNRGKIRIQCKTDDEADLYHQGLTFLVHKTKNSFTI